MRHGTTAGNLKRCFLGVTDEPLLPEGEDLARRLAAHAPEVELVYVSPLSRCQRTAELVWPKVSKKTVKALHETDFGPFEGKNHQELKDDPVYIKWLEDGGKTFNLEGAETASHTLRRITAAIGFILRDGEKKGLKKIAIVSHGGVLMSFLERFGRPRRSYYDWLLPNCGGYEATVTTNPLVIQVLQEIRP